MTLAFTENAMRNGISWEKLLNENELLLWHGAPQRSFCLRKYDPFQIGLGANFIIISAFLLNAAWSPEVDAVGVGITSVTMLIGVFCLLIPLVHDPFIRRRTDYALTSKRAMIAYRSLFGRVVLTSYGINVTTQINFREGYLSAIDFEVHQYSYESEDPYKSDLRSEPVSFENISDGRKVYALFRQIQSEAQ